MQQLGFSVTSYAFLVLQKLILISLKDLVDLIFDSLINGSSLLDVVAELLLVRVLNLLHINFLWLYQSKSDTTSGHAIQS